MMKEMALYAMVVFLKAARKRPNGGKCDQSTDVKDFSGEIEDDLSLKHLLSAKLSRVVVSDRIYRRIYSYTERVC